MLKPSDQEYQITKKIKIGKSAIDEKFTSFSDWINAKYNVEMLNIVADRINVDTTRLQLIFERQKDVDVFLLKNRFTQSSRKVKPIINQYKHLFKDEGIDSILILFYAFEPLAREEAVTSMPLKVRNAFKEKHKEDVWEVAVFGEHVTFFFFTNEDLKKAKQEKQTVLIKQEYYNLLKPYDQFNYFNFENFNAVFDSKENFDQHYDSNWRWYYS